MITDSTDHNSVRLATINVKITIVDTIYCGKGCFDRDHKKIYVGISAIEASAKIKKSLHAVLNPRRAGDETQTIPLDQPQLWSKRNS